MKKDANDWDKIIPDMSSLGLTELEYSALSSWVLDCKESVDDIYSRSLTKLGFSDIDNDTIHGVLIDIHFELQHIKTHIQDAEKGLVALIDYYANK